MSYENSDPKLRERFENDIKRKQTTREEKQRKREEKKNLWGGEVEVNLCNMLESRDSHHDWSRQGWPDAIRRKRGDILGEPKSPKSEDYLILIEVERERLTCVRNVIKAWMYVAEENSKPILFVHVFSPSFDGDKKVGKEEAVFVGKQAQKATNGKLRYDSMPLKGWPTENRTVLEDIVKDIMRLVTDYQRQ